MDALKYIGYISMSLTNYDGFFNVIASKLFFQKTKDKDENNDIHS